MLSCVFAFMLLGRNPITHTSAVCPFVVRERTWSVDCLRFYSQTTVWNSGKRLNVFCFFCIHACRIWTELFKVEIMPHCHLLSFLIIKYVIPSSWKYSENYHQNLSKITIKMSFFLSSFKAYSTMEEHTYLIRENTSNLLLNSSSPEPFQVDKGQASFSKMTTLGAGNMALATPATVSEEDHTTTKRKTRDLRSETPEEQVC